MNRGKKDLLHPIFLECKEHTPNAFWKTIFEEFAYGKYPKQLYITNYQQIQSTNRNQFFQYSFKNKTVEEMIPEIQELLMNHTNLISNEEVTQKKNDMFQYKQNQWTNWRDIKKKYIKCILVMDYCIELKKKFNLTQKVINDFYERTMNLINLGEITEIELKNNKIESIKGLDDPHELKFPDISSREEQIYDYPDFVTNYCKRFLIKFSKCIKE